MDKNRIWLIGSVIAIVAIFALGWVLGVQPQLAAIADTNSQRDAVDQTNAAQQVVLDGLKKDEADIATLKTEYAAASSSIPTGTGVPAYVDQLNALAQATGVTLKAIKVSDAEAYTPTLPEAAAVPAGDTTSTPTPTPTPTPDPEADAAAAGSPASGIPVSNPLITASNFAFFSVGLEVEGEYPNILNFVQGLQSGTRLMLVTTLDVSGGADGGTAFSANVGGYIYSLVDAATAAPTATDTSGTVTAKG